MEERLHWVSQHVTALIQKTQNPVLPDVLSWLLACLEATVGIEPTVGVLQTPALTTWPRRPGAEDGIRTRDPLLGKEVLYR